MSSKVATLALLGLTLFVAGGCDGMPSGASTSSSVPFMVGTVSFDPDLPAEPSLPTDEQVCGTLEASNLYVKRPDGALPPEADPSPSGVGVAADPLVVNPDQTRIQAALDACGAAVDAEVGALIAQADGDATAAQTAAAVPNANIAGVSGEELAKPQYRGSKFAVRLVVNSAGPGNGFISGPLTLPSGVTLWIDRGATLFATRDATAFSPNPAGPYCANTAVSATKGGSSGNCAAFISGNNLVNAAVVGDGSIDSRAYAEIVTTNKLYPLMKVDLTCSNTYAAYATGTQAPDGTACDDGGTVVNSKSAVRNMTWWDLAYLGNLVENGRTGAASQSNFRMMVFNYVKNLTLYRITLNNSANFHVVPAGIDGFTVWGGQAANAVDRGLCQPGRQPQSALHGRALRRGQRQEHRRVRPSLGLQAGLGVTDHRQHDDVGVDDLVRRISEERRGRVQLRQHRRRRHRAQGLGQPQPCRARACPASTATATSAPIESGGS